MSRLRLKQIDDKIEFEKSKNYVRERREPVYEYFGIARSTYLACSKNLKSKISRSYYSFVVFCE